VLGLVAGVLADRLRRRPIQVTTDIGRALLLGAIPLLAWLERLSIPVLMAFMLTIGLMSLMNDAAHQSFLPRLAPRNLLTPANARLQQSASAAATSGPVVGGTPTNSVKRVLKVPSDEQPTAKQTSVTLRSHDAAAPSRARCAVSSDRRTATRRRRAGTRD